MLRFEIISPLPSILGLSDKAHTMVINIPFEEGINLNALLEQLCTDFPLLAEKKQQNQEIFQEYLLVINNQAAIDAKDKESPLTDGSIIQMITPYHGG